MIATKEVSTSVRSNNIEPVRRISLRSSVVGPVPPVLGRKLAAKRAAERVALEVGDAELVDSKAISLRHLATMAADGRLQVEPEVHNMVWSSRKMASSLVVPVIQGKDTPPIMLEASHDGRLRVLGGSPRLTSLLAFVTGSAEVSGQPWPNAPVELDARDTGFIR